MQHRAVRRFGAFQRDTAAALPDEPGGCLSIERSVGQRNSFVLSWQPQWRGVANGEELSGGARNNARCGVQHANGLH
jgi:hypothetical protein